MSDPTDDERRNAIYKIVHHAIEATPVDKKLELVDRYTIALEVTRQLSESDLLAGRASVTQMPSIDDLAQIIRYVDGEHKLGAGALAQKIHDVLAVPSTGNKETP